MPRTTEDSAAVGRFTKGTRRDVVDGWRAPWFVAVPADPTYSSGDVIMARRSSGVVVHVKLVTEYPFASKVDERRFTFESVDAEGNPDQATLDKRAFRAAEDACTDLDPTDGRPAWWSRKEDGSVRWPQDGQVWSDRDDGALGLIVRDHTNKFKVGWYPITADVVIETLDDHFPDGVPREATGRGEWMSTGALMDGFEFVWKPMSKSDRVRAWARENGYGVKDRGRLRADIVAAYEKVRFSHE